MTADGESTDGAVGDGEQEAPSRLRMDVEGGHLLT
jgi:hypothetical protein